jgi:hypothetical protein
MYIVLCCSAPPPIAAHCRPRIPLLPLHCLLLPTPTRARERGVLGQGAGGLARAMHTFSVTMFQQGAGRWCPNGLGIATNWLGIATNGLELQWAELICSLID